MIAISGFLVLLSGVLLGMGVVGSTGFLYASILISLLAVVLLPMGVIRRSRRPPR